MKSTEVALSKASLFSYENVLPIVAFGVPFFVSSPQLLTGTLVNLFLLLSAANFSKKNQYVVAIAPSIGALLNGLVFGKFTPFLAYFLPFIWIGNLIFMKMFMKFQKNNVAIRIIAPSVLKSALLFLTAFIFFKAGFVPRIFLTAMGVFQLITAVLGAGAYTALQPIFKRNE